MTTEYAQPVNGYHAARNGQRRVACDYCGAPAGQSCRHYPGVDRAAGRPRPWRTDTINHERTQWD